MPLKVGNGGNVDEDVLTSLGIEAFPPHLNLDGLGRMFDHLDHHHLVEAADEAHYLLYGVDDQSSQDECPRLARKVDGEEGGRRRRGRKTWRRKVMQ